jgi:predicted DNA-binding protein (UPF0251 family)
MTVKISYQDSNAPLATWDAHLAFIHLPGELQEEIQSDARHEAHSQMKELEPEHYQALADADDSYQSSFSFEKVELIEVRQPGIDDEEFTPSDGLLEAQVKDKDELDPHIRNTLDDWIEEYLTAVRKEINEIQKSTSLSNREFVAFVLAESPRITWSQAAELMGITEGTFSGKIGDKVRPKIEKAEATTEVANRVRREE